MTKQDFIQYLSRPEELNGSSMPELEKLVQEYPYFQLGRMLYLKNLHNENSIAYEKNLHITSAYAPNGKILYNLIKKKSQAPGLKHQFEQPLISKQPREILPKLEPIAILQEMPMSVKTDLPAEKKEEKDEFDELQVLEKEMLREAYRVSMTVDLLQEEIKGQKSEVRSELSETKGQKTETVQQGIHSFGDWMKVVSGKSPESAKEEKNIHRKAKSSIVDNFILEQTAKSTPKPKAEFYSAENMAKKSLQDDENFVSETLARIYLKQGNLPKALRSYEILLVKHPEKIHIFAPLLEKIKKLLEEQKAR